MIALQVWGSEKIKVVKVAIVRRDGAGYAGLYGHIDGYEFCILSSDFDCIDIL